MCVCVCQGYLPSNRDRHAASVERKRQDYRVAVSQSFGPSFVKSDKVGAKGGGMRVECVPLGSVAAC